MQRAAGKPSVTVQSTKGKGVERMRFDELVTAVEASSASDWEVLIPPRVEVIKLYGEDVPQIGVEGHQYSAHYKPNLDISLAWGAEQNDGEPWQGAWAAWSSFPNGTVFGRWAEILWRSRPVSRVLYVTADGGRYTLPAPLPVSDGEGLDAPISHWSVKKTELPLVRLIHDLTTSGHTFDEGMRGAKFTIV